MYQHQPRVGFDTEALDPFVFDPMRSVKCEWEISDGKQVVTGECKSLLRNYAKYLRGIMGGVTQNGRETLKDLAGVDREIGCQTQAAYFSGLMYDGTLPSVNRKAAIHVGTSGTAVAHSDNALGAEVQNTLTNANAAIETSSVVFAIPTTTAAEFAFTVSSTITPGANNTINEVGLSSRLFHSVFSGDGPTWAASRARFLMVRDTVPGGYSAVSGTPYTVKFTFRFLQTTAAFFSQLAARWFMKILHDAVAQPYYTSWDGQGSYDFMSHPPLNTHANSTLIGLSDDTTTLGMTTQGLVYGTTVQVSGKPVVTDELTDAVRCRWNVAKSHTFVTTKTVRQAVLALQNSNANVGFAWAFAKLPTPITVNAGNSQAFKFTFEIAV